MHTNSVGGVEAGLKSLWERTRLAGELIVRLRKEKAEQLSHLHELEREIERLRLQVQEMSTQMREMTQRLTQQEARRGVLLNGERADLAAKIKELLTKLDAYL